MKSSFFTLNRSGIRTFTEEVSHIKEAISLGIGEPDHITPQPIITSITNALNEGYTKYEANQGNLQLRNEIAKHQLKNGLHYTSEEICVTAGASEALFVSLFTMIEPKDEIIVFKPSYPAYDAIIHLCQGKIKPVGLNKDFQIEEKFLKKVLTKKTRGIIVNSPCNPTSTCFNSRSNDILEEFCLKNNLWIISDEVYRDLIFTRQSFLSNKKKLRNQMIVIQSFSKPYCMTGFRLGYIMAVPTLMQQLIKTHGYIMSSVPSFIQQAGIAALSCSVEEELKEYIWKKNYIMHCLDTMSISYVIPDAAFYIFIDIKEFQMDSYQFCKSLAIERGVICIPGRYFDEKNDYFIRLSYTVSILDLIEAMNRFQSFIIRIRNK